MLLRLALYHQFVPLIALGLSFSAQAGQPAREWKFDLKNPGTYEVHVQHEYKGAFISPLTEVTYSLQTSDKTIKRNLPFDPHAVGNPTIVLIADISSSQKVVVTIAGISQPFLLKTNVYMIDANSRYPYEWFDPEKSVDLKAAKRIRDILKQPEQEIDLAKTALIIDKQIDPAIDVEANLQKIDAMVAKIKTMPGFDISQAAKIQALKRYIYEPGQWNNFQPYQYDLDDPLGTKIINKLLSNYIASKKGNCVTMPLLFVSLGQRLGVNLTAATAPLHVLVKVKDEVTGGWYNLETTSGANLARDVWYREQMPMTDKAIANGVYLQPLTKKETVA